MEYKFYKKSGQLKKVESTNKKKQSYLKSLGFVEVKITKGKMTEVNETNIELDKLKAENKKLKAEIKKLKKAE